MNNETPNSQPTPQQLQSLNANAFVQKLVQDIKLLPRNTSRYPEIDIKTDPKALDALSFIYALNILGGAGSGDGNLVSLVNQLWINLAISVQSNGLTEDLQVTVKELNDYLTQIGFFNEVPTPESPTVKAN